MINPLINTIFHLGSFFSDKATSVVSSPITLAIGVIAAVGINYIYKQTSLAAIQDSQTKFDRAFASFPKDQIWRLFIDWNCQERGKDCFDIKEPGYRAGMEKAISYLRDTLGKKLDANEYIHLHDLCIDGVKNERGSFFTKGMRAKAEYGFLNYTQADSSCPAESIASPEAVKEAFETGLYSGYPDHFPDQTKFLGHYDDNSMRSLSHPNARQTKKRINELMDTYYKRIANASLDKEKLAAIVDLCRALEVYHVFQDGNQRTVAFILLPKLLIENGFSPAILERPFMFDGAFTTEEMELQIEQGMTRFSRLRECFGKGEEYLLSEHFSKIDSGITFQRPIST